jgi:CheY-like chemotaxis protein
MAYEAVDKLLVDKKVVLAVEGKLLRELLVTAIKQAGAKSMLYGNGIEMVRQVKDYKPHIIFCEYTMSSLDGVSFLRQIRKEYKLKTPAVMLAARVDGDAHSRSIAAGANETISIPFSVQDVLSTTKKMLELGSDRAPKKLHFGPRDSRGVQ